MPINQNKFTNHYIVTIMELAGKVKLVSESKQISPTFKKRELVLSTEEQYPQHILIEFIQDKTDLLNSVQVGDSVKVGIDIRGREWKSPQGEIKYFNSIHGWRIEKAGAAGGAPMQTPDSQMPPMPPMPDAPSFTADANDEDDLPF